jgi:hypothetical protein
MIKFFLCLFLSPVPFLEFKSQSPCTLSLFELFSIVSHSADSLVLERLRFALIILVKVSPKFLEFLPVKDVKLGKDLLLTLDFLGYLLPSRAFESVIVE